MNLKPSFTSGVSVLWRWALLCCVGVAVAAHVEAQPAVQPLSVSVLDLGDTSFAKLVTQQLRTALRTEFDIPDEQLTRAAAKGWGYSGSLNMSLQEAEDLGAALASDFYLIGDAQTVRRSSSTQPVFYESYCSVFVISARTGRLVSWSRPSITNETPKAAEKQLLDQLSEPAFVSRLQSAIKRAEAEERNQRALVLENAPIIEEAPEEKIAEAQGLRLPRPYRRLRPDYPQTAAVADAEATVDVLVDVGSDGEVGQVQVVRWGGFGLDEATVATVRQLHFFPAMRDGTAVPLRVLLRYNFRRPPRP